MTLSVVIVTGLSGSGKSTAIRALEDQGYYCVDNMPSELVESLIAWMATQKDKNKLALGMDVRAGHFLEEAQTLIQRLRSQNYALSLVYFEAREETLVKRYSETRRVHPMDKGDGVRQAIVQERALLAPLRELADTVLDTTGLSPYELRALVSERVANVSIDENLRITLLSFGFKHGLPLEADMVLDVRFMRNPYLIDTLRPLSGLDKPVKEYVLNLEEAGLFLHHASTLLQYVLVQLKKEGKRRFTIAIGCTGGQHRSVAIVQALAQQLTLLKVGIDIRHRDIKELGK